VVKRLKSFESTQKNEEMACSDNCSHLEKKAKGFSGSSW